MKIYKCVIIQFSDLHNFCWYRFLRPEVCHISMFHIDSIFVMFNTKKEVHTKLIVMIMIYHHKKNCTK